MAQSGQRQLAIEVSLQVNGERWTGLVRHEETLLELLRDQLQLTGTKRSCESQVCGVCTALVDGMAVSACTYLAFEASEKSVTTVEGLGNEQALDPLQEAFIRHQATQCGFCTAGMLMTAKALLLESPDPSREEITAYLNGNMCRCGAYPAILAAIQDAAGQAPSR